MNLLHEFQTWSVLAAAFLPLTGHVNAQTPEKAPKPEPTMRSITLAHVDSETVRRNVFELGFENRLRVSVTSDNTLVLYGDPDAIAAVEQLVKSVDVPSKNGGTGVLTELIDLKFNTSHDLLGMIASVMEDMGRRAAVDNRNRRVVVRGTKDEIQTVRNLVSTLDQPVPNATIQFFFLSGGIGGKPAAGDSNVPKDLAAVVTPLADSGIGSVKMLAPLIVLANHGEEFSAAAVLYDHGTSGGADELNFKVKGVARFPSEKDAVQIEVSAEVGGSFARNEKERTRTFFQVETSVFTRLGKYVILSATPGSTADGDAIVLVIRATRN